MKISIPTVLAAAAFVGAAAAQNLAVFPSDHDPSMMAQGQFTSTNYPLAYGRSRVMVVYETWDLPIPAGRAITRIGFRQGGAIASTGQQLQLQVLMGSSGQTATTASPTFANNYSGTPTVVFNTQLFPMPPMPNANNNEVWITLDNPYTPDLNQNLAIEFRVLANSNSNNSFPYYLDRAGIYSPETLGFAGCPGSSGNTPRLTQQAISIGTSWTVSLSSAPGSSLVALGIDIDGGLLSTPLPLSALVGGASSQCQLGIPPAGNLILLSAVTSGSGSFTFRNTIPNDRATWLRSQLSIQAICLDFFAPGGAVLSNALSRPVGITPANSVIAAQGDPTTVATGSLWQNHGLVTLFDYQ